MKTMAAPCPGRRLPLLPASMTRAACWARRHATLNLLHVMNDGYQSLLLWLLPMAAATVGLGASEIGRMTSLHFLMGVVLAVPATAIAKRLGDELLLLSAAALTGVALICMPLIAGVHGLWLLLLITGSAFGIFHPIAFGLMAERSDNRERAESLGWFTAVGDAGRVVVAGSGLLLATWLSWTQVALAAGTAAVVLAACGIARVARAADRLVTQPADTMNTANPGPAEKTHTDVNRSAAAPLNADRVRTHLHHLDAVDCTDRRGLVNITVVGVLDAMTSMGLTIMLPFLLAGRGLTAAGLAVMVTLFAVGSLTGKMVSGAAARRLGAWQALLYFQVVMAGVVAGLCLMEQPAIMAMLVLVAGVMSRSCLPLVLSETAACVAVAQRRTCFGMNQMLLGAATSLSPLALGLVSSHCGVTTALAACGAVCLLNALVAGLGVRIHRVAAT